jgi:F0F1-type ATP synthase assembly protein I
MSNKWVMMLSLISQIGFAMVTPILLCCLLGGYIDTKLNTSPLALIIFIILGVGGAFRNLFAITNAAYKKGNKKDE